MSISKNVRRAILQVYRSRAYEIQDHLAERARFADRVRSKAEEGQICAVRNGRDCDGVQYTGQKSFLPAIPRLVELEIERDLESADGPMYHGVVSPSEGRGILYESRDLGMEAFENGHPHVLRP